MKQCTLQCKVCFPWRSGEQVRPAARTAYVTGVVLVGAWYFLLQTACIPPTDQHLTLLTENQRSYEALRDLLLEDNRASGIQCGTIVTSASTERRIEQETIGRPGISLSTVLPVTGGCSRPRMSTISTP